MNTKMNLAMLDACKNYFVRNLTYKQFSKIMTYFKESTLPLQEKFEILLMIPKKECDVDLAIEILYSNFDAKRAAIRDQEWADLFAENSPKSHVESIKYKTNIMHMSTL